MLLVVNTLELYLLPQSLGLLKLETCFPKNTTPHSLILHILEEILSTCPSVHSRRFSFSRVYYEIYHVSTFFLKLKHQVTLFPVVSLAGVIFLLLGSHVFQAPPSQVRCCYLAAYAVL